jgi:hypothetical protein
MSKTRPLRYALLGLTAAGAALPGRPAMAQTEQRIQSIENQIKSLQTQLNQMKSELSARDRALKAAQEQAKAAQNQAATAAAASAAAVQAAQSQAAAAQAAQSEAAAAASSPKAAQVAVSTTPPGPPLPRGAFRVGPVTVTLGGFAAGEGIYRSRNMASSIDTAFNSIPLKNLPGYYTGEFRETAQQSRFSLLAEANIDEAQKLTSYLETDFLSAGSSSNSNQSNSYTLRLRQFWGGYDNTDLGLHVLGGQAWSMATMYKTGIIPRQENVPLTIDAQYVVGFNWERQAVVRVVKDFADHKIWAGLSLEEPQTLFSSAAGPNCLTGAQALTAMGGGTLNFTQCGGANVNSIQAYSDNIAPDIIAKIAADPGWAITSCTACCASWAAACPSPPPAPARTTRPRAKASVPA